MIHCLNHQNAIPNTKFKTGKVYDSVVVLEWDKLSCLLGYNAMKVNLSFGGTCCLYLQGNIIS
jgi:hypothetical protein